MDTLFHNESKRTVVIGLKLKPENRLEVNFNEILSKNLKKKKAETSEGNTQLKIRFFFFCEKFQKAQSLQVQKLQFEDQIKVEKSDEYFRNPNNIVIESSCREK